MKWLDLPPFWLIGFMALAWGVAMVAPWPGPGPWLRLGGVVLIALGLTLAVMAVLEMRRARTSVIPHRQPSALVTQGIFALSRNPIYLGDVLILSGWGLLLGSAAALVLVPVFAAVIARRFISAEEARLRAGFGKSFEAWAARTRRWL